MIQRDSVICRNLADFSIRLTASPQQTFFPFLSKTIGVFAVRATLGPAAASARFQTATVRCVTAPAVAGGLADTAGANTVQTALSFRTARRTACFFGGTACLPCANFLFRATVDTAARQARFAACRGQTHLFGYGGCAPFGIRHDEVAFSTTSCLMAYPTDASHAKRCFTRRTAMFTQTTPIPLFRTQATFRTTPFSFSSPTGNLPFRAGF